MVFVRPHWPRVTPEIFEDRSSNSVHGQTLLSGTLRFQITCTRSGLHSPLYIWYCTQVQWTPPVKMINELTTDVNHGARRVASIDIAHVRYLSTRFIPHNTETSNSCSSIHANWRKGGHGGIAPHAGKGASSEANFKFCDVRTFAAQLEGESRRRRALSRTAMWGLESIDG